MRRATIAAAGLVLALGLSAAAAPVTKEQLLSMAREKVDAKVILAIVGRDCVDFDVDAGNAAELSRALPPEVLEAAIACRKAAPKAAAPAPAPAEIAAPPPPPKESPAPGSGTLRLRAQFIGESAALSCVCLVDGREAATLTKEAQGEFGEAVARTKIGRQSPDLPVSAGRHRVVFRCDPKAQEVSADVDVLPGKLRTVEIRETSLRSWKLRKVE